MGHGHDRPSVCSSVHSALQPQLGTSRVSLALHNDSASSNVMVGSCRGAESSSKVVGSRVRIPANGEFASFKQALRQTHCFPWRCWARLVVQPWPPGSKQSDICITVTQKARCMNWIVISCGLGGFFHKAEAVRLHINRRFKAVCSPNTCRWSVLGQWLTLD